MFVNYSHLNQGGNHCASLLDYEKQSYGKKLCDSVFSLHEPNGSPHVEIIFIHGLQFGSWKDAYWRTWLIKDDGPYQNNCWPNTWLKEVFPHARILSMSYDAGALKTDAKGMMDMYSLGESLLSQMLLSNVGIGQMNCPVIFVCHSLGGLIAKQIVVMAHRIGMENKEQAQNLLQNIKGFYFYSTPHMGSRLADLADNLILVQKGPLIEYLKVLDDNTSRLHDDFEKIQKEGVYKWKFSSLVEANATKIGGFYMLVVEEASARFGGYPIMKLNADHFTICKPRRMIDTSFQDLKQFLINIMDLDIRQKKINLPILPAYVVGLDAKLELLEKKLQEVSMVGLVGMGGIGKTTLSKKWYISRFEEYEKCSYLEDVKSKPLDIVQKQLLKDLCCLDLSNRIVENSHLYEIGYCIIKKKVVVVVDDVENIGALGIPNFKCGESKSKVVITSRNWQDIVSHVPLEGKMNIEELEYDDARQLFNFHAFKRDKLSAQSFLEEVTSDIVKACAGLPLSIEVMASYLSSKINLSNKNQTSKFFEEALRRLYKVEALEGGGGNEKLWKRLRISFDDLQEREKCIFLDIACNFCDLKYRDEKYDEKYLIFVWGSLIGVENLKDRSLVKVVDKRFIKMHDQLRDMGRRIVQERADGEILNMSHYWEHDTLKQMVLYGHKPLMNLEAFFWEEDTWTSCEFPKAKDDFGVEGRYPRLRLLNLQHAQENVVQYCLAQLPCPKLTWLDLRMTRIRTLPDAISLCSDLSLLDLRDCELLEELPRSIGGLNNLQALYLKGCQNLTKLPESMDRLKSLQHLDLEYCWKLECLPKGLGKLPSLEKLLLINCISLHRLFEFECKLDVGLIELNLKGCQNLETLPKSFGNLCHLKYLDLSGCKRLERIPEAMGNLLNLENLKLSNIGGLERLPETIGNLLNLKILNLSDLGRLERLPETLGNLLNLKILNLSDLGRLERLPETLGNLLILECLVLSNLGKLERLPESLGNMLNLKILELSNLGSLERLPDSLGNLLSLGTLELSNIGGLERLPEALGNLPSLKYLALFNLETVKRLPEALGNLSSLKYLALFNLERLERLPETLGNLLSLEDLNLSDLRVLERLPDSLGDLPRLESLKLSNIGELERLPETLGNLSTLEYLALSSLGKLERLPETLGNLLKLENLKLSNIGGLERLPETIGKLVNLGKLNLSDLGGLERLPETLANLSTLEYLALSNLERLERLPETLGNLLTLKILNLSDLGRLERLPETLGNLLNLENLMLSNIGVLERLPETLGNLLSLQNLMMSNIEGLEKLPENLGNLLNLKILKLSNLRELKRLPETLGNLSKLEYLALSNLGKLERLPETLGNLLNLKILELSNPGELEWLPETLGCLSHLKSPIIRII